MLSSFHSVIDFPQHQRKKMERNFNNRLGLVRNAMFGVRWIKRVSMKGYQIQISPSSRHTAA